MIVITTRAFRISASGTCMMSDDSTVKSASFPVSIEPRSFSWKAA